MKKTYKPLPGWGLFEFQELLIEIRSENDFSLQVDWQDFTCIEPGICCFILNLNKEATMSGKSFNHLNYDSLGNWGPLLHFDFNQNKYEESDSYAFLSPVNNQELQESFRLELQKYLRNRIPAYLETGFIDTIFAELFANICQHSNTENGLIIVTPPDELGEFKIVVSDLGDGIVNKIRSGFENQKQSKDAAVIEFACGDFITTKTTIQNQGRGLSTLLDSIKSRNGVLEIRSEAGLFRLENLNVILDLLNYRHLGTFIEISMNFNNFTLRESVDYEENIEIWGWEHNYPDY